MKCKNWSNKINNFVVRRLKSIKINGQPQAQQQQQQQATTQQQQYLSTCSTMPAMPKETKATAVSLSENNFTELKFKELTAMSSTATATTTTTMPATQQQQQQQQQARTTCGCGAASAEVGSFNRNKHFLNGGHTSPLAAAIAGIGNTTATQTAATTTTTTQRNSMNANCCRTRYQNGNNVNVAAPEQQKNDTTTTTAAVPATTTTTTTTTAAVTPPKKSPKDFIFGKYIGEGSFSIVYLAVDVNTKREYAIKVCDKRHILRERKQEYIRREREVMHIMSGVPGFVNLSCTFQDNRSLYFVMTYAKKGDLLPYITKVGSFDVDCTRHYAAELVLACEQMHRRNVVHRDLKPENILLDEHMHTLIADFGSAKILTPEDLAANAAAAVTAAAASTVTASTKLSAMRKSRYPTRNYADDYNEEHDEDDDDDDTNDTASDDMDSPSRQPRYERKRRGSFVGTAQYVSPEVLQNGAITPAADLWALGCIIYQMISGLPPFRGSNDYVIFKEILACDLDFPLGFDKDAEDLVRQLLKVNPSERLGAKDGNARYESIRAHRFFAGINFDTVRDETPPQIYPYLPGVSKDDDFRSHYRVPEHLEPGLDDKQLTRLLGMELGTALDFEQNTVEIEKKTVTKNNFDLTDAEKQKRLEQQKSDKWHVFTDNEVILKKGYVNKRKGLFARKRMLLLTTGPRLIYIDPVQMVKKGEIPWGPELSVEPKNFKIFFVHTPNRTYYLEDPEGYSLQWVDAIDKMRLLCFNEQTTATMQAQTNSTTTNTATTAMSTTPPTTRTTLTATSTKPLKTASN